MEITKKDYLEFSGIDLDIDLKKSNYDNPTRAVEIFIERTKDWCETFLKTYYAWDGIDGDEAYLKKGILHQMDYLRRNGDLSVQADVDKKFLAPNAYMQFKLGGFCNIAVGRWARYGY